MKNEKQRFKNLITVSYALTAVIAAAALSAAFLPFGKAVSAVVALISAAAEIFILKAVFGYSKDRIEMAERLADKANGYAEIFFNKNDETAYISERFTDITGLETERVIGSEEYKNLVSELIACRSDAGADIYMAAKRDSWIKIYTCETERFEVTMINDVSDYASCKNIIKGLKYYDRETGLLCRDAFIAKVRAASEANAGIIGLVTILLSGMERVRSFKDTNAVDTLCGKAAAAVKRYENPHNIFAGRASSNEFCVLLTDTYEEGCKKYAEKFLRHVNEAIRSADCANYIRVYCGYAVFSGTENEIGSMLSAVDYAAYEAKNSASSAPVAFNDESYTTSAFDFKKIQVFNKIIDGNLLNYHFQPIVNAHTGDIFGYEALMRPQEIDGIRLYPPEVIEISEKQGRLDEIEKLTLFNTVKHLSENQDLFRGRKLFINSIPNCFVSDADYNKLFEEYSGMFDKLVIEITENCQISDESIALLSKRYKTKRVQFALDDYGTGYANDSTLLSIKPDFIKIDRSLITGINLDSKKQHLVKNMIDFAKSHGIKVLGEGVETREELETLITFGVDLIQGFYTAKPNALILLDIPEDIKNVILDANIKNVGYVKKSYTLTGSEPVNILELAAQGYTDIILKTSPVTLNGNIEKQVNLRLVCEDGYNGTININNVNITGVDSPVLTLGKSCEVLLNAEGDNLFLFEGIRVPETSRFILNGGGKLEINTNKNNAAIIGGNSIQEFGDILVDMEGSFKASAKGDNIIGIGGGIGTEGSSIRIIGGKADIKLRSAAAIGIGSVSGSVPIMITKTDLNFFGEGQTVVAIGSKTGKIKVECNANLKIKCAGDNCCGIGTLEGGSGLISLMGGSYSLTANAKNAVCIGAISGNTDISINSGYYDIFSEGNTAVGIGDAFGSETITIVNGIFKMHMAAANEYPIGTRNGKTVIHSGNINSDSMEEIAAVSPYGDPLEKKKIDISGSFRKSISFGGSEYTYSAEPIKGENFITAYLPAGYEN